VGGRRLKRRRGGEEGETKDLQEKMSLILKWVKVAIDTIYQRKAIILSLKLRRARPLWHMHRSFEMDLDGSSMTRTANNPLLSEFSRDSRH
jgi:hypothetical protein